MGNLYPLYAKLTVRNQLPGILFTVKWNTWHQCYVSTEIVLTISRNYIYCHNPVVFLYDKKHLSEWVTYCCQACWYRRSFGLTAGLWAMRFARWGLYLSVWRSFHTRSDTMYCFAMSLQCNAMNIENSIVKAVTAKSCHKVMCAPCHAGSGVKEPWHVTCAPIVLLNCLLGVCGRSTFRTILSG